MLQRIAPLTGADLPEVSVEVAREEGHLWLLELSRCWLVDATVHGGTLHAGALVAAVEHHVAEAAEAVSLGTRRVAALLPSRPFRGGP